MSTMLIVLVSILLAVLVAVAAVYYGGIAYLRASNDAQAAALMTQGNQIKGAAAIYTAANQGTPPTSIDELVSSNYLQSPPPNWSITTSGELVTYKQVTGTTLCQKFNQKYDGYPANAAVPSCSSVSSTQPVCCD